MERSVLQAGKVFITEGEENFKAYVVQNGQIRAFTMRNGERIDVNEYGAGSIIAEMSLLVDDPPVLSYEATTTTTVVVVTRQDFQKTLSRADKTIKTVLDHVIKKLHIYESGEITKALKKPEIDEKTTEVINSLLGGLSEDKKAEYQTALSPHINGLIKEIKKIKGQSSTV